MLSLVWSLSLDVFGWLVLVRLPTFTLQGRRGEGRAGGGRRKEEGKEEKEEGKRGRQEQLLNCLLLYSVLDLQPEEGSAG